MGYKLRKYHKNQDTLALLEKVRLTGPRLAEARAQLLRAEAMADFLHGAWRLTSDAARRMAAAVARKTVAIANSFARSAMDSGERRRDAYLAKATDTAELEQRVRSWQARWYVIRSAGVRGK
ncbi:MAG: hypothetical protein HY017_06720 [Betaproteobacteria bacterium]|nr:hypothetical protein [Betaproteobacteria bacterium]